MPFHHVDIYYDQFARGDCILSLIPDKRDGQQAKQDDDDDDDEQSSWKKDTIFIQNRESRGWWILLVYSIIPQLFYIANDGHEIMCTSFMHADRLLGLGLLKRDRYFDAEPERANSFRQRR